MSQDFQRELAAVLNKHGKDSLVGIPDYILASWLDSQLNVLATTQQAWQKISKDVHIEVATKSLPIPIGGYSKQDSLLSELNEDEKERRLDSEIEELNKELFSGEI